MNCINLGIGGRPIKKMSQPNCIWGDCTNKSHLYSRLNGVRVCSQECLRLYQERKSAKGDCPQRFQELWFLHISLWQQIFYERVNFGEGEDLKKLEGEIKYNSEAISLMSSDKEAGKRLRKSLDHQRVLMMTILEMSLENRESEKEREEWLEGQEKLLEVIGIGREEESGDLMREYNKYLLELMEAIVRKSETFHCTFRLLVLIVSNLSQSILNALADPERAKLSIENEPKTMMMRPENGRQRRSKCLRATK